MADANKITRNLADISPSIQAVYLGIDDRLDALAQ